MTTATLALVILAAILAQITIVVLVGVYRRRRQYRRRDARMRESQAIAAPQTTSLSAVEPDTSGHPWAGFREFSVQRREYEDGNRSICSFYLVPLDAKPLLTFKPGQFLTFRLAIADPISRESKTVVRCYSLSDAPRADYYRVSIKRVPAPPDRPDLQPGISSGFFHDHVHQGHHLLVKAPSGHFHLNEDEPLPIVLIGGGIGITPMLSILNRVLDSGVKREVWLFYGVRNGGEHIMKERLQALARQHRNFHLHVCYSAPQKDDDVKGDYQHHGRVDVPLLRTTLKLMRYQFYVCGPKPMMESLVPDLEEWGVDSGDIYYESFGPATLIKHEKPARTARDSQPISITFSRSGKSLTWDPAADSLLEFAEANAVEVDSGCHAGSCGTCQTALMAGEVEYNQQPDTDIEPGHCLLCIATPRCDLVLEA